MHLKIRPVRLAWLVMHFCYSLVVASTQVARTTLRFGHTPRNAVVKVDLRSSSDFVLTVVAEMTSLVPGSLVIEADRARHRLFVHILDVSTRDDVERFRRRTLALERRVVLALGAQTDHLELADPLPGEATR
jgi:multicomponent Na+:H+ antiporter subunit E